jgi:histidinol-phosphatase (PHP family)
LGDGATRPWASFHGGHTTYGDGEGTVAEVAQSAVDRGFAAFGISEHFVTPPIDEFSPDGEMSPLAERDLSWLPDYVRDVRAVQSAHSGETVFLLGTELEYIRGAEEWTKTHVEPHGFDYFVGSVHFLRYGGQEICIDWDRARTEEALRHAGSPERLILDYYEHIREVLDWRLASVIGHMDLIKIQLAPEEQVVTDAIRAAVRDILTTMRDRDVAIDVNARGLIKTCRAIYPAEWILVEARKLGVPVTLGDDSHGGPDVGARLDQAVALLRRAGYEEMAIVEPGGALRGMPLPPPGVAVA